MAQAKRLHRAVNITNMVTYNPRVAFFIWSEELFLDCQFPFFDFDIFGQFELLQWQISLVIYRDWFTFDGLKSVAWSAVG